MVRGCGRSSIVRLRQVAIAKGTDVDMEVLATHPNVVKRWCLPYGYVLFEFYHPIFDKAWDSDFSLATWHHYNEPSKSQVVEADREMKRVLAPLFDPGQNPDCCMYTRYAPNAVYRFFGRERHSIKWPKIGLSQEWSSARRVRLAGRLFYSMPETTDALAAVIGQWHECLVGYGESAPGTNVKWAEEHFSSIYDFEDACGDATMALFMILTATRNLTSLEAVGFFLPDDYTSPFFDIRGLGEMEPQAQP